MEFRLLSGKYNQERNQKLINSRIFKLKWFLIQNKNYYAPQLEKNEYVDCNIFFKYLKILDEGL